MRERSLILGNHREAECIGGHGCGRGKELGLDSCRSARPPGRAPRRQAHRDRGALLRAKCRPWGRFRAEERGVWEVGSRGYSQLRLRGGRRRAAHFPRQSLWQLRSCIRSRGRGLGLSAFFFFCLPACGNRLFVPPHLFFLFSVWQPSGFLWEYLKAPPLCSGFTFQLSQHVTLENYFCLLGEDLHLGNWGDIFPYPSKDRSFIRSR